MMADVNGDGQADLVGFGENQVEVYLGQADGTFTEVDGGALNVNDGPVYVYGWSVENHIRTMADVNGDGKADIVGINDDEVYVWLGQSNGTFVLGSSMAAMTTEEEGLVADVNGDGLDYLIAFGSDKMAVFLSMVDSVTCIAATRKLDEDIHEYYDVNGVTEIYLEETERTIIFVDFAPNSNYDIGDYELNCVERSGSLQEIAYIATCTSSDVGEKDVVLYVNAQPSVLLVAKGAPPTKCYRTLWMYLRSKKLRICIMNRDVHRRATV
jgi:hypothetical protein